MYGKIYEQTFTGSMAGTGSNVFAVWAYVIANTGPDSLVELNPYIIGTMIGMNQEDVAKVIEYLSSPDPNSRSKSHRGRRLVQKGQFIYFVPQAHKYRCLPNDKERKEYFRDKQRERRQRLAEACQTGMSNNVKDGQTSRSRSNKQYSEAEEVQKSTPPPPKGGKPVLTDEQLLEQLASDSTYAGIDVKREYGKMINWCRVKKVNPTQRRFVNWLNRAERPMRSQPAFPSKPRQDLTKGFKEI
jgi:hypothetical protein